MEIRGLVTVQKNIDPDMDVFEAFKIMQEINRLKGMLEKTLKGNKTQTGVKSIVESAFKPNQLVLVGANAKIIRSLVKVGPKQVDGYEFYNYKLEQV